MDFLCFCLEPLLFVASLFLGCFMLFCIDFTLVFLVEFWFFWLVLVGFYLTELPYF